MTLNAIAISDRLEAAGLDKRAANAVASEIVDFTDDRVATKADIARLEGKMETLESRMESKLHAEISRVENKLMAEITRLWSEVKISGQIAKINLALTVGLYVGLAVVFFEKAAG